MLITRRALPLLGALAVLPGCVAGRGGAVGVPATGRILDTVAARVPEAAATTTEEHVVLRDFLKTDWGVVEENALAREARRIADRLLAGWTGPRTQVAVYVVPMDVFTAEAARDGAIMLSTGTFEMLASRDELRSEDALAFILAHELSHILLGHVRDRSQVSSTVRSLTGLVTLGAVFVAGRQNAATANAPVHALLGAVAGAEAIDGVVLTGWSREQEYEADALGADLMAKAGYSLQVIPRVMAVLDAIDAEAERRRQASAEPAFVPTDRGFQLRFGPILQAMWTEASRTHPSARDRSDRIAAYIEREWDDHTPRIDTAGMRRMQADPAIRAVVGDAKTASRVIGSLRANRAREADAMLKQIRGPVGDSAVSDLARAALGQSGAEVLAKPRSTLRTWQIEAGKAERANRLDQALDIVTAAEQRFDQPEMLVWRIGLLRRMGRTTEANLESIRCFTSGRVGVIDACQRAARGT